MFASYLDNSESFCISCSNPMISFSPTLNLNIEALQVFHLPCMNLECFVCLYTIMNSDTIRGMRLLDTEVSCSKLDSRLGHYVQAVEKSTSFSNTDCCTADSQANMVKNQLYKNQNIAKLVLFPTACSCPRDISSQFRGEGDDWEALPG